MQRKIKIVKHLGKNSDITRILIEIVRIYMEAKKLI